MIRAYRTRAREVQAIDLLDGRHLVLEDPPRYVPSDAFDLAFELVPERRAVGRQPTNGNSRKKRKGKKGARRSKRASMSSATSNGDGSAAPGSERLAAAIAARTSDHPTPRRPNVDRAIDEVRSQVDRERRDRQAGGGSEAGAKPGKGRKACPKCHILSGARAAECGSCGHKFVAKAAKR